MPHLSLVLLEYQNLSKVDVRSFIVQTDDWGMIVHSTL